MLLRQFDVVCTHNHPLLLILVGPLKIPHYEDGVASALSEVPLDIQNPREWQRTFEGFVCYDLVLDQHVIVSKLHIQRKLGDHEDGYIPFDRGTGKRRLTLGLIELAKNWWRK